MQKVEFCKNGKRSCREKKEVKSFSPDMTLYLNFWGPYKNMQCRRLEQTCHQSRYTGERKFNIVSPSVQFSSVQSLSRVQLFATPWITACQASLSITNSQSLLRLMSIESVMPSNHLILCHPLFQPSILPSIRVFPNESALHIRWPKYWSQCYHSIISSPNLLLPVTPSHRKSQLPPTSPGSSPRSASGPDTNPSVLGSQSM